MKKLSKGDVYLTNSIGVLKLMNRLNNSTLILNEKANKQ